MQPDNAFGAPPGGLSRQSLEAALAGNAAFNLHSVLRGTPKPDSRRAAVLILFTDSEPVSAPAAGSPEQSASSLQHPSGSLQHPSGSLQLLLTKRSETMRHHPGQISFPGGGVDPQDRDAVAAALRETHEETGIPSAEIEVLKTLHDVYIPVSDNIVTPVIGWWQKPRLLTPVAAEAPEILLPRVSQLLLPENRVTAVFSAGNRRIKTPAFLAHREVLQAGDAADPHLVWGFTGTVLASLFEGFGWAAPGVSSRSVSVTG